MNPLIAHLFSLVGDDRERLRRTLLDLHLDRLWLNTTRRQLGSRQWLQVDAFDLRSGRPLALDPLAERLSTDGRAVQLFSDGRQALCRMFEAGKPTVSDEGTIDDPAFRRRCEERLGDRWTDLVDGIARAQEADQIAGDGTEVLVRGRLLALPEGTPRWPQLFTFHARRPLRENGDRETDQLALVLLDLARAEELCRQPVGEVLRFLALVEAAGPAVLGPLRGALAEVRSILAQLRDDREPCAPLVAAHPLIYEVLAMGTALGYGVGDELIYFDQRFFPMLSLNDSAGDAPSGAPSDAPTDAPSGAPIDAPSGAPSDAPSGAPTDAPTDAPSGAPIDAPGDAPSGAPIDAPGDAPSGAPSDGPGGAPIDTPIEDGLDEIAELGVLSAMAEVLPYSVPEGELLEAFADDEIQPLVRPAGDQYEGSLFLLDHRRLHRLLRHFDGEALGRRAELFLRRWHRVMAVEASFERWCADREALDGEEMHRFAETVGELQILLALAEMHGLRLGLLFYAG